MSEKLHKLAEEALLINRTLFKKQGDEIMGGHSSGWMSPLKRHKIIMILREIMELSGSPDLAKIKSESVNKDHDI